ncbi:MAG: phosphatidate cytidylyltransferase [Treponema sp.]|nr:phosphatidate cytidylyltransferase [Treponema sp.]
MSKVFQRLLVFFIGIPLVLGIVFLDYYNHLPLNAVIVICSCIASVELFNIFKIKTTLLPQFFVCILSLVIPLFSYIMILLKIDIHYSNWVFLAAALLIMTIEILSKNDFNESIASISECIFIVFYCGLLPSFLTRMTLFKEASLFIAVFLFTVFINDSLAWLFGVLFGKNNRNVFKASPNKSIAGFCGGCIGAIASCILAQVFWRDIFYGSYLKGLLLGILCSFSGITGDLVESVFKRSAGIKDSGNIIPGRGGLLDSIDSVFFTAPIFFIAVHFLFTPELLNL